MIPLPPSQLVGCVDRQDTRRIDKVERIALSVEVTVHAEYFGTTFLILSTVPSSRGTVPVLA
jgi:hypothetical protein